MQILLRCSPSRLLLTFILFCFYVLANNLVSATSIVDVNQFESRYPRLSSDNIIRKAVQGDALAQHELGNRLASGSAGLPSNPSAAAMWLARAAQRGFPGSASLDALPNSPIRIDRTITHSYGASPIARLSLPDGGLSASLTQTLDGSASSATQTINRVIWDIADSKGDSTNLIVVTPSGTVQALIQFPDFGIWFVTLIVMDSTGQLDHVTHKIELQEPVLQAPDAPVAIDPLEQSIAFNEVANFQWEPVKGAVSYEFEVRYLELGNSDALFATQLNASDCNELACTVPVQMNYPNYGAYAWRVSALNAAGVSEWTESTFRVLPPEPSTPLNLAPLINSDVNEGDTVTFTWQADPLAVTYDFHFFERVTGSEIEFEYDKLPSELCSEGECSLTRIVSLPVSDNHAWRVRARNAGGVSDWSRSLFNVIEPVIDPPSIPQLLIPAQQAIVEANQSQKFSWAPANLASAYEFQLLNGDPNAVPLPSDTITAFIPDGNCTTSTCSISVVVEFAVGSEPVWRVKSINPAGESDWASSSIAVIATALTKPNTPIVVSPPPNTDLIVNEMAEFTWQLDPQAATYEFHFFNNAPGPDRGAREPFITGLRPQDLCVDSLCTYPLLVDLPEFSAHAWRIRARNSLGASGWTRTTFNAVAPITNPPPSPTTIAPFTNALLELDTSVSFSWSPLESATQYEFQIINSVDTSFDAISAFVPATICSSTQCAVSIILAAPLSTTYQWQVRASNAAGASEFTLSPFSLIAAATAIPETPENLTPVVGLQLSNSQDAEFTWVKEAHAVNYEFHFFNNILRTETPFIVGLRARDICSDIQCVLTVPVDLPVASNHAWRVRGQNSLGYSEWSRSSFDVIEPLTEPPSSFVLLAPTIGETVVQDTSVNFTWQPALRAIQYEVTITDGTETAAPLVASLPASSCTENQCTYTTPITLAVAQNHEWQVRAINPLGISESLLSSFAVGLEVIEPPEVPVAVVPEAGAVILSGSAVDFQWQADNEARSYEFYITDAINGALPVTANLLPAELCDTALCTHSLTLDLPVSNLHTWHVRVFQNDLASAWSQRSINVVDTLGAEAPFAQFIISGFAGDASGVAPLIINVDPAESSDDVGIQTYEWDFGDASETVSSTSDDLISHEYTEPGSYTVTLTVTDGAELSDLTTANVTVFDPATAVSANDASRLLTQATFGPNTASILEVQTLGIENWIEQQFALQGPAHLDYVRLHSNNSNRAPRHEVWWRDVVEGDDQLRQRMAFALSQLFVVADTGYTLANAQYGITHYYDLLREQAFGNYRDLLETITLNPVMGLYLSMLQNAKGDPAASTRPDENYAREVLQLFSIGLHQLNMDGTTDGTPSFTQDNIEAFARTFTGWNYADAGQWNRKPFTNADIISPMRPFESFHDTDAKTLLNNSFYAAVAGGVSPAGQSARQDLDFALDNIFNHPNVAPFISKQLIKRLVTSNPSTTYVADVASVFEDNGAGVRGDLKAVVREILLNSEARTIPTTVAYGKLREPVLRLTHLWRAFDIQPGSQSSNRGEYNTVSPQLMNLDTVTGQAVLKSPSVFNFFQPSFSPAGPVADANLKAPEFELFTESNELATTNRIGRQIQRDYASNSSGSLTSSYLDFTNELSLASDTAALLDHFDLILLSGNMSENLRTILTDHINALPDTTLGLSQRVRDAITLIMASPDYLVQM